MDGLTYTGPGYIIGVPARDLSADEIISLAEQHEQAAQEFAALLTLRGLYRASAKRKITPRDRAHAPDGETTQEDNN